MLKQVVFWSVEQSKKKYHKVYHEITYEHWRTSGINYIEWYVGEAKRIYGDLYLRYMMINI